MDQNVKAAAEKLRLEILEKTAEYYRLTHGQKKEFVPGQSAISYAGRVFDEKEMQNAVDASLEFWLTSGHFSKEFESKLAKKLGVKHAMLCNSGSSANLLAFMGLTSPLLEDRRIRKGDEVITVAAGFPTTIAPMLQFGAVPVFLDVHTETANIDTRALEAAYSPKTKAVMIAHTLGNPFDLDAVTAFCKKYNLWLVEDNCDALGSEYRGRWTGTFGDVATSSFYPPHHITMGEGGAVYTNKSILKRSIESFRDWGRDCWCDSGKDNTCGKRFDWELGTLPCGYDHKYTYRHIGYNLKATDIQAAIGCVQLDRL
ncbi:MAG TPA: lipopolysaccharide biosynthesis protein RfbH, partial [bacterium]|nr:lipopolysaccharide biosynthesis protein RfbH [bacterium]